MASASPLPKSLPKPTQPKPRGKAVGRVPLVLLLSGLLLIPCLPWIHAQVGPRIAAHLNEVVILALLTAACALWCLHLVVAGTPRLAAVLLTALLLGASAISYLHHPELSFRAWLNAIGCGIFVYALVAVFHMHQKASGLQAIASAAIVLSIGILAKPAVLILCGLFSLITFFEDRRLGGSLPKLILLLFTPLLLCLSSLILLSFLYYGNLAGLWWVSGQVAVKPALPWMLGALGDLWPIGLGLAALLSRLMARYSSRPDLVFVCLGLILPASRSLQWMPDPVTALDLSVMLVAGGASLLAAGSLRRAHEFFLPFAALLGAIWFEFDKF